MARFLPAAAACRSSHRLSRSLTAHWLRLHRAEQPANQYSYISCLLSWVRSQMLWTSEAG